jgi:hypothetical protein
MPDRIPNKTVITNTVRKADTEFLRAAGAARVITTTPIIEGESFATNVMEGVIVALTGRRPETLTPDDYRTALCQLHWSPSVIELQV